VDNIEMVRREIGWDGMDWIDLAAVKFLNSCTTGSLSRRNQLREVN
jgi:hypothetical protein